MAKKGNNNILQRFNDFRNQMRGKDPQAVLNNLISSGQVSTEQVEKAVSQAKQLQNILK